MKNPEKKNEEKVNSIHKTKIEYSFVESFFGSYYKTPVSNVVTITGGEGSQAFSYEVNGESFILRVNKHDDRGFKKDQYAFEKLESNKLPIPKVIEIGKMEDGQNFAISKKVEGKLFKNLSDEEFYEALPNLFETLQSIHCIDVSDKEGYGKWDEEGVADKKTWKEFLINVDEFAKHMFENSMLEQEVWDFIYARFIKLIPFCPEEKYLIHGDYGFDNLLGKDGKVTGVIDWEHSMYGDFLYDVAWLQFFSKNIAFEKAYLDFLKKTRKDINNFDERMLCYKLYIGLGSLSFYAYSQQSDKYELSKNKLLDLVKSHNS